MRAIVIPSIVVGIGVVEEGGAAGEVEGASAASDNIVERRDEIGDRRLASRLRRARLRERRNAGRVSRTAISKMV